MATTERDYYELLGVTAERPDAEIKKAFRKLARELHPDVSDEPDAQTRFREVAEAYEVLSKPETRDLYDRFGHAGLRRGGFTPGDFDFGNLDRHLLGVLRRRPLRRRSRGGRARGADVAASVDDRARRGLPGRRADGRGRGRRRLRALRRATAPSPEREPVTCPTCGGSGRLQQVSRSVFGEFVRTRAARAAPAPAA